MIQVVYYLIITYFAAAFVVYLFRERKFWAQASTALLLIMFILRLLLVK